jgi:3',5'-cyclic AMP phosphodiesterase CpdA
VGAADRRFVLAHCSDPHISWRCPVSWRDLAGKRMLGYLGWRLRRGAEHREEVLDALQRDLREASPDHIAVTGDLTHLGLPREFENARRWLRRFGAPERVTVVPGNHDAYVRDDWGRTFARWGEYMASDDTGPSAGPPPLFPVMRRRGPILLIGLSTAHPNPLHLATGGIGAPQLTRLATALKGAAARGLFRVILIHHPPVDGVVTRRKRLTDAPAFLEAISRYGAELILHGHAHRTTWRILKTTAGVTAVAGAPSASALGRTPDRRARYAIYRIRRAGRGWNVDAVERLYSPGGDAFLTENRRHLHMPEPLA